MDSRPFERYLRWDEIVALLASWAAQRPDLMRVEEIGRSHEGRPILLATLTRYASGEAADKPALWVDGNIHATELAGSSACLYLIHWLLENDGRDADATRCLDGRAFYVCPRVNPDGAEQALASPARCLRSSTRPWPWDEPAVSGLVREDLDGDGRILWMRVPDANGAWKAHPADPRLLVRRDPAEVGGTYYRVLPEGRIEHYDGATLRVNADPEGLDLNRNFPAGWRPEQEQAGAGPYPTSEPEAQALVGFIAARPNICGAVTFHTWSGVLLRPYSHQDDETMPAEDRWTYRRIGEQGTELTGYPAVSAYHDFRYHPQKVITGNFDDWMYDHRGVHAWTVEIWSPQREAGIRDYHFIDWYRDHPPEHDLMLLRWNDEVLGGRGFIPWRAFDHPQLGPVEVGGWDTLYSWSNPPPRLLEREIARFPAWLVWQLLISPRLELLEACAVALGDDTWRVRLVVQNTGWLPTCVTQHARERRLTRGVVCEIALPAGARLESGEPRVELAQLEGRAHKAAQPGTWLSRDGDPTDDRAKAEWIVRAPPGSVVGLSARHERGGVVRVEVGLSR